MRKREIERKLNLTISAKVPDVLDNVLEHCEKNNYFKEGKDIMKNDNVKMKNVFLTPKFIGALAVILVVICGYFGYNQYTNVYKTDSVISFDVNPSIEIKVNKNEKIIDVIALNEDAKKVLDDMDFKKVDLDVAVNAIIGSMLKNGYISIDTNSILVSVENNDVDKANKIKDEISKEIEEILSANSINGSVMSQAYDSTSDVKSVAKENDLSEGKAKLINKVIDSGIKDSKGNAYTFEALSKLSINELNVLLSSKKTEVKEVKTTGSASETGYIGKDKAKEIALKDAGVTASNVRGLEIEFDAENGTLVYEVEFNASTGEYEYDIDAKTGKIVISDIEKYESSNSSSSSNSKPSNSSSSGSNNSGSSSNSSSSSTTYISKDKAKQIALSNAGVSSSSVRDLQIEFDKDDGRYVYEVEFESSRVEYKYEINAKTGSIIKKEIDKD